MLAEAADRARVAATVGTLVLARAVDEPALTDRLCAAAIKYLSPR